MPDSTAIHKQGDRFPPLVRAALPADQQAAHDRIEQRRGRIPAPFVPLLASPEVAEAFDKLSASLQHGSLPAMVREAVFLITARRQRCAYLWINHVEKAMHAGLDESALAALANDEIPAAPAAVASAGSFVKALLENHRIPQPLFEKTVKVLGLAGVVELTAFCGFAASVAMLLNMRQPALPPGPPAPFATAATAATTTAAR